MASVIMFLQNFNSIKVRLKHSLGQPVIAFVEFQFHKGTIKTRRRCKFKK